MGYMTLSRNANDWCVLITENGTEVIVLVIASKAGNEDWITALPTGEIFELIFSLLISTLAFFL